MQIAKPVFSGFMSAVFIFLFLGTSGAQQQGSGEMPKPSEAPQTAVEASSSHNTAAEQFVFTPGDALKITVYPDTAGFPNGVYTIDEKGYADLPLVGYNKVSDKSVEKLELLLKEAYVNFLPQPNLEVRPLIRVTLLGGFFQPGLYWVDPQESMWSLIQRAGGTQREDGIEKLTWKRSREYVSKDLVPQFESGASLKSIGFKSGDQIRVVQRPKERFWDVFRMDILPILGFTVSSVAAASTAYIAYENYKERR